MALYKCKLTFDIVVDAKDRKEAIKIAESNIHDEITNTGQPPISTTIEIIRNINDLPENWLDAIPWNEENHEKTCLDILTNKKVKIIKCKKCKSTTNLVTISNQIMCKTCAIQIIKSKQNRFSFYAGQGGETKESI